jgi:hypothetical protein
MAHLDTMRSTTLQDIGAGVTVVGDYVYYTIDVGLSASSVQVTPQGNGNVPTYIPVIPGVGGKILTTTPGIDGSIIHVVQLGDTIWSIAQAYKVSEDEILQLNSLKDNFIYVGNKLVIRLPFTPTPIIPASTPTQQLSQTPSPSPTTNRIATTTEINPQTSSPSVSVNHNNIILISIIFLTLLTSGLFALIGRKGADK